jgi:hypothetical protein
MGESWYRPKPYTILVENLERKPLSRHRHRRKGNIKIDLREIR